MNVVMPIVLNEDNHRGLLKARDNKELIFVRTLQPPSCRKSKSRADASMRAF